MKNAITALILGACALLPFLILVFLCLLRFSHENLIGGTPFATSWHISFCGIHFSLYPTWGGVLLLGMGILLILSSLVLLAIRPVS